ncbi:MAG: NADH-quinone oxidoreductase subunit M [Bythopirellula sp.]|nr:NADH-quinone oxidoreductase subunit M [Bythopirellula sp.]
MNLLLIVMIFLPALGAILVALEGSNRPETVRKLALFVTLATLVLAVIVATKYETTSPEVLADEIMSPQMVTRTTWFEFERAGADPVKIEAYLGIDGISIMLVVLTALLTVSAVLVSWTAINVRVAEFFAWMLILETGMLGVFCAFDLILFYVFFEFTLIPLFFIIGIWGDTQREYAAGKFFIYTLTGSLISLLGLLAVVLTVHAVNPAVFTFSIPELAQEMHRQLASADPELLAFWKSAQFWMFLALFAGFAIKVPLFPFHTWLPLAHVEAPTAGSVLLAGVLLKLGSYGFLRLAMPLLPLGVVDIGVPLVATLSVIGILYGGFCALSQRDMKRLVAYSSVSHLGFCMLGLFALNAEGIAGGTLQMINHGLSTGALFLLVGMIYERLHTRQLDDMGGLATRVPIFSICLIFACLSSMGLPGLNGFVGETLSLIGMFRVHPGFTVIATFGIIIGAWYLLNMIRLALFGTASKKLIAHGHVPDLNGREIAALAPIMALCLLIGVFPQPFLDVMKPEVDALATIYADKLSDPLAVEATPTNEHLAAVLPINSREAAR